VPCSRSAFLPQPRRASGSTAGLDRHQRCCLRHSFRRPPTRLDRPLRRAMAHRMPAPPQARATFLPARFLPQNGCSMLNSGTPRAILDDLFMRGCAAPRALAVDHFVVRGQFLERGRNDWAVLCIGHDRSSILVFERNHRRPFAELDPRPEDDQRMPRLARFILPMGPSKIRDISVDRTARESASGMTG
jgi:hypothetical protein